MLVQEIAAEDAEREHDVRVESLVLGAEAALFLMGHDKSAAGILKLADGALRMLLVAEDPLRQY